MPSTFERVRGLHPRRSRFNLSYGKAFDCDMGQLIPTMARFMLPGDIFTIHQESVVRSKAPLRSPAFAELNEYSYTFFTPLRILMGHTVVDADGKNEWEIDDHAFEKFINPKNPGSSVSVTLPRWIPTGNAVLNDNWNGINAGDPGSNAGDVNVTTTDNGIYSLWDYLEYPIDVIPQGAFPLDFFRRAYCMIYNEWFLNKNVMDPVDIETENRVLQATWKKDYFTSMLPWQQRGSAPALPISGTLPVSFAYTQGQGFAEDNSRYGVLFPGDTNPSYKLLWNGSSSYTPTVDNVATTDRAYITGSVDLANAAKIYINDLRVAFQIQRWMELSAQFGSRYVEYLKGFYGVSPTDDTLQRPMFIGGCKSPVIISEVLQTSETGGDGVGSMKGHSISADRNYMGRFRATEFGVLMTISVIRPKAMYHQGIDREQLYVDRLEFMNPSFVNLSEQAVMQAEIFATDNDNLDVNGDPKYIGFQARYNELRTGTNKVCGALRGGESMSFWAMTRSFDTAPILNGQFLKCIPKKDIFVVTDEPAFVCFFNNRITSYRPIPLDGQPGLIDHVYGEGRR